MTAGAVSFFELSKKVAEDFLSTALIVDDNADFESKAVKSQIIEGLEAPDERESLKSGGAGIEQKTVEPSNVESDDKSSSSHRLDAKAVIKSFSEKSIFCTIIKPEKDSLAEDLHSAENLSANADIVVIDWSLHGDKGGSALSLIDRIVTDSTQKTPEQIRLVAVYTGEPDVNDIANRVFSRVGVEKKENDTSKQPGCDDLIGKKRSVKIIILAKEGSGVIDEYKANIVPFDELAERLVVEFTKMTSGLLSNVALAGFAAIRKNTHKILSRFSPEMDEPYLTHRICLENPEEAEIFAQKILSDEIMSMLFEYNVGNEVHHNAISSWIDDKGVDKYHVPRDGKKDIEIPKEKLKVGFQHGVGHSECKSIFPKNPHTYITRMLKNSDAFSTCADHLFSYVSTIRTAYSKKAPMLSLGTIIKDYNQKYWICILPRCDSVRIKNGLRVFPFLPLHIHENGKVKYPLCLPKKPNEKDFAIYALSFKAYDCKNIQFVSNNSGFVSAFDSPKGGFFFKSRVGNRYEWIGELKFEFAQQIADLFSKEISRVGTDTPEWLSGFSNK